MSSNKYFVRFLSIAEQDLQELASYIAAENVKAALTLLEKIQRDCLRLGVYPYRGKIPNDETLV